MPRDLLCVAATWLQDWHLPCHQGWTYGVPVRSDRNLESLPLLKCSPSAWSSRLLYRRGRKSRRVLRITVYFLCIISSPPLFYCCYYKIAYCCYKIEMYLFSAYVMVKERILSRLGNPANLHTIASVGNNSASRNRLKNATRLSRGDFLCNCELLIRLLLSSKFKSDPLRMQSGALPSAERRLDVVSSLGTCVRGDIEGLFWVHFSCCGWCGVV
jgi:hypothetical protein